MYDFLCDNFVFSPGSERSVFPLSGSFVHKSISTFYIVIVLSFLLFVLLFSLVIVFVRHVFAHCALHGLTFKSCCCYCTVLSFLIFNFHYLY